MNPKPKFITKENYRQFKPSEFVQSFISDIDVAIEAKIPMDLSSYLIKKYKNNKKKIECLPCLGGMSVMNMKIKKPTFFTSSGNDFLWTNIAHLGDRIRQSDDYAVFCYLIELYPDYKKELEKLAYDCNTQEMYKELAFCFSTIEIFEQKGFNKLKNNVQRYVNILQDHNL